MSIELETAKFLMQLADRLDDWAKTSQKYGWSTHQVRANQQAASECRAQAAKCFEYSQKIDLPQRGA